MFNDPLEQSLYTDEEILKVTLWGPFTAIETLNMIQKESRVAKKAVPPQITDDLVSQTI